MPTLYGHTHKIFSIIKVTYIPRLIHTAVYCSLFTLYTSYYAISDKSVETAEPHTASCHLEVNQLGVAIEPFCYCCTNIR